MLPRVFGCRKCLPLRLAARVHGYVRVHPPSLRVDGWKERFKVKNTHTSTSAAAASRDRSFRNDHFFFGRFPSLTDQSHKRVGRLLLTILTRHRRRVYVWYIRVRRTYSISYGGCTTSTGAAEVKSTPGNIFLAALSRARYVYYRSLAPLSKPRSLLSSIRPRPRCTAVRETLQCQARMLPAAACAATSTSTRTPTLSTA